MGSISDREKNKRSSSMGSLLTAMPQVAPATPASEPVPPAAPEPVADISAPAEHRGRPRASNAEIKAPMTVAMTPSQRDKLQLLAGIKKTSVSAILCELADSYIDANAAVIELLQRAEGGVK